MTKETSLQACDIITTSNPVLADCPPIKEEQDMNSSLTKLLRSTVDSSRDDELAGETTALSIKRQFSKNTHKNKVSETSSFSWTMVTPVPTSTDQIGNE